MVRISTLLIGMITANLLFWNPAYCQRFKYSELVITRDLSTGALKYEQKQKNGSFIESPYPYVKRDGKVVVKSIGNLFRFNFTGSKIEITTQKPFGDSLTGPFSITGLPSISLPRTEEFSGSLNNKRLMRVTSKGLPKNQIEKQLDLEKSRNQGCVENFNTLSDISQKSIRAATTYGEAIETYKLKYARLYSGINDRQRQLDERKVTNDNVTSLRVEAQQIFDSFFVPFDRLPSTNLTAMINDFVKIEAIDLTKLVNDEDSGLKIQYSDLRKHLSTIDVLGSRLLEECGEDMEKEDKDKIKKIINSAQKSSADLEKANSDVVRRHEIVISTDWSLYFTRFWQTKEEILSMRGEHVLTTIASGDKMDIRQSLRVMKFEDGKILATMPTIDTVVTIKVKGTTHINVSAGFALPFLTETTYVVKPNTGESNEDGAILKERGGLGSPYLTTMFDVSWSNFLNINPIISAGLGYPLQAGSVAIFAGSGVAFEIGGRRVLFHGGVAYVKSNVLSGGYNVKDNVAADFEIPVANGYRFKPFLALTYNLTKIK